ncbi:hypothetical protein GCM10027569_72400 [Flindersiella endophytica]
MEFAPLLAVLGQLGRHDAYWLAKPFSRNAKIMAFLSPETDMVLHVVPRTLARDRANILNSDLGWRLIERTRLLQLDELSALNQNTLTRASGLLSDGHIVTVYPVGRVADATRRRWQRGVGSIIKMVEPSKRDSTSIALFRFDDFSQIKLLRSLVLRSHGFAPRPYTITLRVGVCGSISELLGGQAAADELSPAEVTAHLRRQFLSAFRGTAFAEL